MNTKNPTRTQSPPGPENISPMPMRPFSESLPMALLRAREAAMGLFRPLLNDHGLTEQQWRVLRALTPAPPAPGSGAEIGELDVGEIAARTNLLGPSLTRILANLESRNLVTRRGDPHDARRSVISLSPIGVTITARVAPHSEATYNRIEDAFGADRLATLLSDLNELRTCAEDLQP